MDKKMITLLITASLLFTSCGSISKSPLIDEPIATKVTEVIPSENVIPSEDDTLKTNSGLFIKQDGPYGSISIVLPDGWSYNLYGTDNNKYQTGSYGIQFYPNDVKKGYIELCYCSSMGLCGTGLESKQVNLAGDTATMNYYDGSDVWSIIIYEGKNEKIVANASYIEEWWSDYSKEAMKILNSLTFNTEEQKGAIGVYESDSSIPDLSLNIFPRNVSPSKATIEFDQYDSSVKSKLTFGEAFIIEKKEGDTYKELPVIVEGDYGFNEIAYIIEKEQITNHEYDWEWLYGVLKPGDYRIVLNVSGDKNYPVYGYFIIR